jgi:hypothetical protein
MPTEVSKAMIEAYTSAEKEAHEAVVAAVAAFFQASRPVS